MKDSTRARQMPMRSHCLPVITSNSMVSLTNLCLVPLKIILVAVFSLSGYRYLGDGGTDQCEILHDGTYRSRTDLLPFWGQYPRGTPKSEILGLNFGHLTAKTVSRSVTYQLELNISSTRAF